MLADAAGAKESQEGMPARQLPHESAAVAAPLRFRAFFADRC